MHKEKIRIEMHPISKDKVTLIVYELEALKCRKDVVLTVLDKVKGIDLNKKVAKEVLSLYFDIKKEEDKQKNIQELANELEEYGSEFLGMTVKIDVNDKKPMISESQREENKFNWDARYGMIIIAIFLIAWFFSLIF